MVAGGHKDQVTKRSEALNVTSIYDLHLPTAMGVTPLRLQDPHPLPTRPSPLEEEMNILNASGVRCEVEAAKYLAERGFEGPSTWGVSVKPPETQPGLHSGHKVAHGINKGLARSGRRRDASRGASTGRASRELAPNTSASLGPRVCT